MLSHIDHVFFWDWWKLWILSQKNAHAHLKFCTNFQHFLKIYKPQNSEVYFCGCGTFSPGQVASLKCRYFHCVLWATGCKEPLKSLFRWDAGGLFQVGNSVSSHKPTFGQTLFGNSSPCILGVLVALSSQPLVFVSLGLELSLMPTITIYFTRPVKPGNFSPFTNGETFLLPPACLQEQFILCTPWVPQNFAPTVHRGNTFTSPSPGTYCHLLPLTAHCSSLTQRVPLTPKLFFIFAAS